MTQHDDFDEIDFEIGRRAPFSQLGDWVVLSGATGPACKLYWILSMHVNVARGDNMAKPSRATLAELMGLAKAKSVDTYLTELEKLAAIDVMRGRRNPDGGCAKNRYIVHQNPPPGYTGLRSNEEFYLAKKAKAQEVAGQTPVPSEGLGGVVPQKGLGGVVPCEGPGGVVPSTGGGSPSEGPPNKTGVNKKLTSPLRGDVSRVRDAPAHASTPPEPEVSSTNGEPQPKKNASTATQPVGGMGVGAGKGRRGKDSKHPLPDGWEPSERLRADMAAECPQVDLVLETRKFRDYWIDKKTTTDRGWEGTWRNWIRRAWEELGRPSAPSLFDEPQGSAGSGASVEAGFSADTVMIANAWLGWWSQNKSAALPSVRPNLLKLVQEALDAGASVDQIKRALWVRQEPCPWPDKFMAALAGENPRASAGMGSRQEAEQNHRDLRFGRGLLDAHRREQEGTADDPDVSIQELIRRATASGVEALREAGELPGQSDEDGWPSAIRGEIAQ